MTGKSTIVPIHKCTWFYWLEKTLQQGTKRSTLVGNDNKRNSKKYINIARYMYRELNANVRKNGGAT